MPLAPGARLGPYEILGPIDEGGMGEVYKARDTRLNRSVAAKVSKEQFSARFEREARAIAAVNHPNICALYDIGPNYLVMELIEGQTLSERLKQGAIPIDEALRIATQIADALEAAHEKGITHRDLKPRNIIIKPEGTVKVLDFGLAKLGGDPMAQSGDSPTITAGPTQAGMILGTAAYMSPEQARAKEVDRRADIWAFGVILYEMLVGRCPFGGENMTDRLAAVVLMEPDYTALPPATPPGVRRLLRSCLRKDPKQRLRDIGDARLMLDEAETDAVAPQSSPPARRTWLPWMVAGLALAAAAAATITWQRAKPAEPLTVRFPVLLPEGTTESLGPSAAQAVPSPDGRYLAFIAVSNGESALWVRPMASTVAHRLDETDGANLPFWSPDGQFIAFFATEKLKKIPAAGGSPQTLCDAPRATASQSGEGGTWNDSGVIVFALGAGSPLWRVRASGGPATFVTTLDASAGETRHSWPQFLPDGRHVLYFAGNRDPARSAIYVQALGSSQRTLVIKSLLRAAWSPPGYLLFPREHTLFAQRMDPNTFHVTGEPVSVTEGVSYNENNGRSAFAVSGSGILVCRVARADIRQLDWYSRDGKLLSAVGKPGSYGSMRLSPDEKSAAIADSSSGRYETWIMDLVSGALRRASDEEGSVLGPWSPDSDRMTINEPQAKGILEFTVGPGTARILSKGAGFNAVDWSPDSHFILCNDTNDHQLAALTLDGNPRLRTLGDTPYARRQFRFSPDGKFVAYTSLESGSGQILVASFPSFAEKRQISVDGGEWPTWRQDGREVFFRTSDGTVMSAEIQTKGKIEAGVPKRLFRYSTNPFTETYSPTGDGKRFLVLESEEKGPVGQMMVVMNWTTALKRP